MVRIWRKQMSSIELRYLASREWMESEILSGRPVQQRDQVMAVDVASVDAEMRQRVEVVADAVVPRRVQKRLRMCVLDSGIDPDVGLGDNEDALIPMDASIVHAIGTLPELPEPSSDLEAVVSAWEKWIQEYTKKALAVFQQLITDPPAVMRELNPFALENLSWGSIELLFGEGFSILVSPSDGAKTMRDAKAGLLWSWAASKNFSSESCTAAREATAVTPVEAQGLKDLSTEQLAERFLRQQQHLFQAAKAHNQARRAQVPDFDVEMERWAQEHGSDRLRLGVEDGYRMHSRYLAERIAAEAPGMYAMPAKSAQEGWAYKASSPSETALRLRRKVAAAMALTAPPNLDGKPEAEIVIVKKPPHGMFLADPGMVISKKKVGVDLPSRKGWPWRIISGRPADYGANPFEAVVVKHWLGRYHLIGAVSDGFGGPAGIWAVPDLNFYEDDGKVHPQDPDAPAPEAAKRKPPDPPRSEDDIPF
jgi:hypothetical protein